MSFKREGNDIALLSSLKRRRITELVACNIPDDEAAYMNDGRLTCLVCNGRPILDTIEILKIHRASIKHKQRNVEFCKRKEKDLQLIEKRLCIAEEKGDNTDQLLEKRTVLLGRKPLFRKQNYQSKKFCPKPKIQLTDLPNNKSSTPVRSKDKLSHPESSSVNRLLCLDKVAQTVAPAYNQDSKQITSMEMDKNEMKKKELQLLSQGWIRDRSGSWVQDPDVEFDSDDEPT